MSSKNVNIVGYALLYIILSIGLLFTILPFLWMLSTSFKAHQEIFIFPIQWIPDTLRYENYIESWTLLPFDQAYINSIKITLLVTVGTLFSCSMAGYAFAKLNFSGKQFIFSLLLATMMIP